MLCTLHNLRFPLSAALATAVWLAALPSTATADEDINVLFLGSPGHHVPKERFEQIKPVLEERGIKLAYTENLAQLNADNLANYDGLLIYANIDRIEKEQEAALLDFVAGGKGLIPIHCASACFGNSDAYIELVGGQFQRHETGVFRETITEGEHPVAKSFGGFESWDETYVHTRHNDKDRTVLSRRVQGDEKEPWTWVRTHGKGRVFYTAWGHDQRTWGNPGFQNLLERGIRWATGRDPAEAGPYLADLPFPVPKMTEPRKDVAPFEFVDVGDKIPNYTPGEQWGAQGENLSKMQKPLSPEESIKHFVTPEGFHVELFAAEPDLGGKPIALAWDERGRLWVCETYDYPNELQPPGKGRDRIRICEDTDDDGKADKFTVFAEELSIPTAIAFHQGGAIVQEGGRTVYLKDTDGDDKADERRVMFTGWGMGDTHGGVSNFRYGLDNWIWAMQGYNASRVKAGGETHEFRQGFFRFKPDGSKLEFIRSTDNNTWGLGISEEGLIFGSTANRNPSVFMPIPNRYYEAVRGWSPSVLPSIADTFLFRTFTDKIRQVDQHGGYTAAAGHALYTARNYPQEYWNSTAFVCEPTGHLIGTFVLRPDGSGFRSNNLFNLVASDDEWSAPIMAEVGPDGNVWFIDWYNYIVQHNPTPRGFRTGQGNAYESDLRDKRHGRIYRVVYDKAPLPAKEFAEPYSLADASPEKLVAGLKHPNMTWRLHAQRLLVERAELESVAKALAELADDKSVDDVALNVGAIHALGTLHGLGAYVEGKPNATAGAAVLDALAHPSPGVRRAAVLALSDLPDAGRNVFQLLEDSDSSVRLAVLLAVTDMPRADFVGNILVRALKQPSYYADRWFLDATIAAAARHSAWFLASLCRETSPTPAQLAVAEIVAEHVARGKPSDELSKLVVSLTKADPVVAESIIRGLANGWPRNHTAKLDADAEKALGEVFKHLPAGSRGALLRLAESWGTDSLKQYAEEIAALLLENVKDGSRTEEQRVTAARELVSFSPADATALEQLLAVITPQTPPQLAQGILAALRSSTAESAGELIAAKLPELTPSLRAAGLETLLSRPEMTAALLKAIEEARIDAADLSLDQRQALASHPDEKIAAAAKKLLSTAGGLPNPDRQKVVEEFLASAHAKGDAAAGKELFKKHCAKCHVHSGEGTRIGPDLTGMAVHPKDELLVQILDPSRSVEGNFRQYTVETLDGLIVKGLLAGESKTSIELFDTEGKKQTVLREDINQLVASKLSLMPEGFEKTLKPQEFTDLLEFLTQRGKFLPLDLRKVATITSVHGMFYNKEADVERLIFDDWGPKTVKGVPFQLVDPQEGRVANVVMLHGPNGEFAPKMPKSVLLPVNAPARAIHLLSGVSGWGYPFSRAGSVSVTLRIHYAAKEGAAEGEGGGPEDGETEDHELKNGEHFADYIRRVDVPKSELAFMLRGQQIRFLSVLPQREDKIEKIEFLKGDDVTAPVVMAATVETR